jgi:hypothetical protein
MHWVQSFRQLPALTKRDRNTIAALYSDYPTLVQASNSYSPAERPDQLQPQPNLYPNPNPNAN